MSPVLTVLIIMAVGCSRSNQDSPDQPAAESTKVVGDFILSTGFNPQGENSKRSQITSPNESQVRRAIEEMDWSDPRTSPGVAIYSNHRNSSIGYKYLELDSLSEPELRVFWSERPDPEKPWNHLCSQESIPEKLAADLLASYLNEDAKYKTQIEWIDGDELE